MKKKFNKIKIQLIFVLALTLIGVGVYLLYNRHSIYDFEHLTRMTMKDYGEGSEFTPLSTVASLQGTNDDEMLPVADNETLTLFINPVTSNIAVLDKRNGYIWYSCPPGVDEDQTANTFEKGIMRSLFGLRYYDEQRRRFTKWSYQESVAYNQFEFESIPNGVRILYEVGDASLGIDLAPKFIEIERFQERFISQLTNDSDRRFFETRAYRRSSNKEGFMEMPSGFVGNAINIERMLNLLNDLGYDADELALDNEAAGFEMDLDRDSFIVHLEFILQDDMLVVNMPLDKFETSGEENLFFLEFMKYFGAGGLDEEGYILVPSGSGGLIDFNNRKVNEETFISAVYGLDPLMNVLRPQVVNPVRLPVLGIKRENAAMIAWVESGAALATINADVAGKNNDYNIAWFTFLMRDYMMMQMAGGSETDMTIIQQQSFEGDLTLHYRFIANEDADYTGMALAYQRYLKDKGVLTALTPTANTPFYLDILGAVEKRSFILGTPYNAMEPMTTYEQANEIVDMLNSEGVHSIQMRWLGWFNKGINHHVAKKVKSIGVIGSRNEMRDLNNRLMADGGGLYPGVGFQMTSWFSRNLTRSYEVSRDPAGFQGVASTYNREFLRTRGPGRFHTDWFLIINPGVLPYHMDDFMPSYDKVGIGNLALNDLGDVLSSSIYRKNPVDREHSRLIANEQLKRLDERYPSIMVSGGNDYALGAADHLIDIPTEMDRYYILDHEVPFYQIVMHGYIDYAGTPANTREIQDTNAVFLNMLATGASPRYLWSYQPTRNIEFTSYDVFYSTEYANWFAQAVEQYRTYNEIYKDLRTERIVGHSILSESSSHTSAITMTEFENGTRIYVNTTHSPYEADGYIVPAMGYYVYK